MLSVDLSTLPKTGMLASRFDIDLHYYVIQYSFESFFAMRN